MHNLAPHLFVEPILTSKKSSDPAISTGLGRFCREKFKGLLSVRSTALGAMRSFLIKEGFKEATTSSLVNIAGSCENPYASFTLDYYGREAHLSQSAQLQLEAIVIRLKQAVFTVNNSFREEDYADPESSGRRLSEFTLIEPERPYEIATPEQVLEHIITTKEQLVKSTIEQVLLDNEYELKLLGSHIEYLKMLLQKPFRKITYDDAISVLNSEGSTYRFGDDLGIKEERKILSHFDNIPTFVTHYPAHLKFFNVKRTSDGQRSYSVDLLTPRLGETAGGAVREEDGDKIKNQLLASRIAEYIRSRGGNTIDQFQEYLNLFEQEEPTIRAGFGLGFERFIGFILNSTDILETIAYRSMQPKA